VDWENTAVVIRNDSKIREKEGLTVSVPVVLKKSPVINLEDCQILMTHFYLQEPFVMNANLEGGQKTGFFLDQNYNLQRTAEILTQAIKYKQSCGIPIGTVKILDICCYLGQWSLYFGLLLKKLGVSAEFVLLDVSEEAINKAKANLDRYDINYTSLIMDVVEQDFRFEENSFDLVIVDPPAFIKNKKSIPTGKHAYQKLNSKALPFIKNNGFMVSCSCSGLLSLNDFKECLQKTFSRNLVRAKCLAQGGHAPDHPFLVSFPEGYYLKMLLHIVNNKISLN
ncbi:MAG: methyltransferase domain-containing protein, partial [Bdellovibrionaceae bacterium]|nr:methyltransferase domain-containing protein [Pseudobdellovibrionaceae bacterium]